MKRVILFILALLLPVQSWAAITVGTPVLSGTTGTTGFTIVIASNVKQNDILVLAVCNRDATANPSVSDNEGAGTWARIANQNAGTNGAGTIWWKRASASTAGKTITVSGCTGSASGCVVPFIGAVATGTPFGTPVSEANISGNETQVGITTTAANSRVIFCVFNTANDTNNATTYTATSPTTLTEHAEGTSTGGNDCSASLASNDKATAGATGSINWAQTDGTTASIAIELLAATVPTYQSADDAYGTEAASATRGYAKPAGLADGDVMFLVIGKLVSDTATFSSGSGFTLLDTGTFTNVAGNQFWANVWYKPITDAAGEPATYTISWATSTNHAGASFRVSGANATSPISGHTVAGSSGASTLSASVSFTPNVSDNLVIHIPMNYTGGAWTPDTAFTEQLDNSAVIEVATRNYSGQAATGGVVATNATSAGNGAFLISLSPNAPAAGITHGPFDSSVFNTRGGPPKVPVMSGATGQ